MNLHITGTAHKSTCSSPCAPSLNGAVINANASMVRCIHLCHRRTPRHLPYGWVYVPSPTHFQPTVAVWPARKEKNGPPENKNVSVSLSSQHNRSWCSQSHKFDDTMGGTNQQRRHRARPATLPYTDACTHYLNNPGGTVAMRVFIRINL